MNSYLHQKSPRILRNLTLAFAVSFSVVSHAQSEKAIEESTEQSGVVYSQYSEITKGQVTLYVRNKDSITCGANHIYVIAENVDPKEITFTSSGGTLMLEDGENRSYLFRTNCKTEKCHIYISWRQESGKITTLAQIPLLLK